MTTKAASKTAIIASTSLPLEVPLYLVGVFLLFVAIGLTLIAAAAIVPGLLGDGGVYLFFRLIRRSSSHVYCALEYVLISLCCCVTERPRDSDVGTRCFPRDRVLNYLG